MSPLGLTYLWQTFRYLSIYISFVPHRLCSPPPSVIVQRASFVSIECGSHCKEATVPMFQCFDTFVVANNPLVANSSCLPALPIVLKSHVDLLANHFWICSLAVWAFVPNQLWTWVLIGRADLPHSRPHICCSVGSIFLNGQGLAANCTPVER